MDMSLFSFDYEGELTLAVGETCDVMLKASIENVIFEGAEWSCGEGLSLYGKSTTARAVTALKEGRYTITASYNGETVTLPVTVKAPDAPDTPSCAFAFDATLRQKPINPYIHGCHHDFGTGILYNHKQWSYPLFEDLKFRSMRMMLRPLKNGQMLDEAYNWEELLHMTVENHVPLSLCFNPNETDDNIIEILKRVIAIVGDSAPIVVELGNEVYADTDTSRIATAKMYCEWMDAITPRIKALREDIIVLGVALSWDIETQRFCSYERPAECSGENGADLMDRLAHWNNYVSKHCDVVDGITIHPYCHTDMHYTGMTEHDFIRNHYAFSYNNERGIHEIHALYGNKPFYLTEWGCVDDRMFWGTRDKDEQIRYQWLKTPTVAIVNMERLMNYIRTGLVDYADFHCVVDSQGFGVMEVYPTEKQLPNYYVFRTMGRILENCDRYYNLSSGDMKAYPRIRPWYHGKPVTIDVNYVESWGFGDETDIRYAVFSNHTDTEQTVSLSGKKLTYDWSYGGTCQELVPDWMRNRAFTAWHNQITYLEEHHLLPKLYPEVYEDTLIIPPRTILVAKVSE